MIHEHEPERKALLPSTLGGQVVWHLFLACFPVTSWLYLALMGCLKHRASGITVPVLSCTLSQEAGWLWSPAFLEVSPLTS